VSPGSRRRLFLALAPVAILLLVGGCAIPRWPVESSVTSPYGIRMTGRLPTIHRGVDLRAPEGTEVQATMRGRVRFAGTMSGFGQVVWIDHPGDVLTLYAHLSEIRVSAGEEVRSRQVIGLSGSTGRVTAPHLHFEVWVRGREVDPVPFLGGFPRR